MIKLCCTSDYCNSNDAIMEVVENMKNITLPKRKEGNYRVKKEGGKGEGGRERGREGGRRGGGKREGERGEGRAKGR